MDVPHKIAHVENVNETIMIEDWIDDNLSNLSALYEMCNNMKQGGFHVFDKLTFMEFCTMAYKKSTLYSAVYEEDSQNF